MAASSILGPSVLKRLKLVFDSIDIDKSGTISVQEFQQACRELSICVTQEEVDFFLASDASGDGKLNFQEFSQFYVRRLEKAFKEIDADDSGEISVDELKGAFEKLGFPATKREVRAVLAEVDRDQSGTVDLSEFCAFFCSLPSPSVRSVVEQWASGLSVDTGADLAPPPLPPASIPIWRALLAGGVAGVVSRTATAPLEKIKILAQTSTSGRVHILDTFRRIWSQEQLRGLFAGNGANCLRVLPFSAFVCLAYSNLAKHFPLDGKSSKRNAVWRMGAGAFAGVFATVLTHPMDVIRARLTVQSQTNKVYRGIVHGLVTIAQTERLPGLYRGIGPTLFAIAPFMAVQQVSYDMLKQQAMLHEFQPNPTLFFVCGSVAGATAQTIVYPLEVLRRRMQVHSMDPTRRSTSLWTLAKTTAFRELFAGLTATYLKVMPAAAISLLVRDAMLGRLKKQ